MAGIALLSGYLRFHDLTATSLWLDEAISVSQASGSFAQLIERTAQDNYPPLHNILLFISMNLLGHTDLAARLPSAMLSVLDVLLVAGIGARCGGRVAGLVAAIIVATSGFHVWYGHEARMYALLSFSSTWFAWASLGLIQRPSPGSAAWALVASAALVYSHPFGLLNWGAIGLGTLLAIVLFAPRRRDALLLYAAVGIGTVIAFLPWALVMARRAAAIGSSGFWIQPPTLGSIHTELSTLFAGNIGLLWLASGVLVLVASLFQHRKTPGDEGASPGAFGMGVVILTSWLVLPFVLSLLISYLFQPLFLNRYLIAAIPPAALLAALGASRWSREPAYAVVLVLAATLLGLSGYAQFKGQREDWRGAASYLGAITQPTDCVVVNPWYAMTPLVHYYANQPACLLGQQSSEAPVPDSLAGRRVHLVGSPYARGSEGFRPALLQKGYIPSDRFDFAGVTVETLLPPGQPEAPDGAAQAATLQGAAEAPTRSPQAAPVATSHDRLEIVLQLWGTEFMEDPTFAVMAGGEVIGSGATKARSPEEAETFRFTLPTGIDPETISVALTNDRYVGADQDVNLFVKAISVGQYAVDLTALGTGELQWFARLPDGSLALVANSDRIVIQRPADGW